MLLVKGNLFDTPSIPSASEHFEVLLQESGGQIERIISHHYASPPDFWYDSPQSEWVVLLRGQAALEFTDNTNTETILLNSGDYCRIAPRQRHRIAWTAENTLWLAVHFAESSPCD
ncbi:hypothetical protein TPSD3_12760 [Thioflexithrix psekupsensis]|uniref:Cupin n=1 Tax=Thioflexithrix psekupsensis TaxID=1570016 RepID=A0A251X3S2_9GAMM|nr:hypothetical protein TPSD3_12760 [Thioflexithrix psekupsensis]